MPKRTIDRYADYVEFYLACPACLDGRERETAQLRQPVSCVACGATLVLRVLRGTPYLAIQCRSCGGVYEGLEGRAYIGAECACPQCGAAAANLPAAAV